MYSNASSSSAAGPSSSFILQGLFTAAPTTPAAPVTTPTPVYPGPLASSPNARSKPIAIVPTTTPPGPSATALAAAAAMEATTPSAASAAGGNQSNSGSSTKKFSALKGKLFKATTVTAANSPSSNLNSSPGSAKDEPKFSVGSCPAANQSGSMSTSWGAGSGPVNVYPSPSQSMLAASGEGEELGTSPGASTSPSLIMECNYPTEYDVPTVALVNNDAIEGQHHSKKLSKMLSKLSSSSAEQQWKAIEEKLNSK